LDQSRMIWEPAQ